MFIHDGNLVESIEPYVAHMNQVPKFESALSFVGTTPYRERVRAQILGVRMGVRVLDECVIEVCGALEALWYEREVEPS